MNSSTAKTLILFEMLGLLAAGIITSRDPSEPWLKSVLTKTGLKRTIAAVVLLTILLLLADLGLGGVAATFGAVILSSYLAVRGGQFGEQLLALERRAFA